MLRKRVLLPGIIGLALVALVTLTFATGEQQPSARDGDYLPLEVGNRWELRSRSAPDPMVLEVTDRDGDVFVVRWDNPFIEATFRFRDQGGRIVLVGLDMGQGNASIPDAVYWDFERRRGDRWKSPIGGGEVTDANTRVETEAGTFSNAVEVRTIDQDNQSMYWTFAPGTGLVRWGRGRDAYLLTSFRQGDSTSARTRRPTPRAEPTGETAVPRSRGGQSGVLIGLDANANSRHGGGDNGKRKALAEAVQAGATLLHTAPKWDEIEKSNGKYTFTGDLKVIADFADQHDLPLALNVRTIDTTKRSMPRHVSGLAWDDPRMAERLSALLRAFPANVKRQTRLLAIGNEVDPYFSSRRGEIGQYATLIRRVADVAREEFPNAQLTVNYTFGVLDQLDRYRDITDQVDFLSLTYYPLNADFTMRPVSDARRDIRRMVQAAGDKRVYIQEIGYASSEQLGSSPEAQARFTEEAFEAISEHSDRIVGATFLFMSDLSRIVVEYLGLYYMLPNSGNFKAYLATLGLQERDGTPKPAWEVFRREALALKGAR